ncbi:MAG: ABC transporter substrate-binding protein [Clostridia bacterium]|nr:ABC transporter substrate-binding protein [Clostridia bacterium]
MKRKLTAMLIAICMMVFGLAACGGSAEENDANGTADATAITFVLDWTPNTNHTGIYVADALGYFDEAGLKVEIVQPPDDGAEAMVASGQAQFGVSFQDYLVPALAGPEKTMPITAVAAILQHNISGIMSAKEKGIDSPKKMEGHSYATWELPIEQAIIKRCVEAEGGDFSSIEMLPETIDDEVTALKSDQVDCIWVYYGWAGINAEIKDFAINYFAFKDIDPAFDYYSPVIIANDAFLADNPDTAKAFLAAVAKGYEYAIENPEEAAEILIDANPEIDADLVKASQNYLADQYQAEAAQWGVFDAERWNGFYEFINKEGLAEQEIPMDVGFTNDYLPEK